MRPVATFSIVARDEQTQDFGVAVASKFLAVGAAVPWLQANVGAIATQSYANTSFGPRGLSLLQQGRSLLEVEAEFASNDEQYNQRQFGMVSANGHAFSFTGSGCHAWAGGRVGGQDKSGQKTTGQHLYGTSYAAQGNLLTGPEVVDALAETFEHSSAPFPTRLLEALLAADRAGGDARGRQSAALVVVRVAGGYGGFNDRMIDLRVDDHADPVPELQRLYGIHRLLFEHPLPENELLLEAETLLRVRRVLKHAGQTEVEASSEAHSWNEQDNAKLLALMGRENLEERFGKTGTIDKIALEYLEAKYLKEQHGKH